MIDRAKIHVRAGNGGNGCVAFHREKYVPKGGPSGGDGGHGGHVYIQGSKNSNTLNDLHYRKSFFAENGEHGKGEKRHGKDGQDITLLVPLGTLVMDSDRNILFDIREHGQTEIAAKGGKGGLGNYHFATPTRQAPRFAIPGERGEEKELLLELKLIADVGLVGEPNAGKSTLLSRLSNAKPKIGDYPFTTLEPLLGLVKVDESFSFVMADIPGLIEGAHQGKGLGHEFLRHIERTKILVYLIDQSREDKTPGETYQALRKELGLFKDGLVEKPSIIVLNKNDVTNNSKGLRKSKKTPILSISAYTARDLKPLLYAIKEKLQDVGE